MNHPAADPEGPQFQPTAGTGVASAPRKCPGDVAGDGGALVTVWIYVDTSREAGRGLTPFVFTIHIFDA